jgi:PhnB protein
MNTIKSDLSCEPYLVFGGRCEEALQFYRRALGAKIQSLVRFREAPKDCGAPANWEEKIMHSSLQFGDTTVMASDGCWTEQNKTFSGFALSLALSDEAEADRHFKALAEGGQIKMPMEKTFFAQRFGMVTDRFGVAWMIMVPAAMPQTAGAERRELVAH